MKDSRILYWAKKIKCLEFLNTFECECGENHIVKLCFHHINDDKENTISSLNGYNFIKMKEELSKCMVMCQNCHQEFHSKNENSMKKNNKLKFMEFLNKTGCEMCGYNKCLDSLDFHHNSPDKKTIEFRLFNKNVVSVSEISEVVKNELLTCTIVCRNCHLYLHYGENVDSNMNLILDKLRKHKPVQSKLPVSEVMKMYKLGIKQIEISKHFNASKGTISDIIKRNKVAEE